MIVDPRAAGQPQTPRRVPEYAEDGSARSAGTITLALLLPVLSLIGVVVAAAAGSVGAVVMLAVLLLFFGFLSIPALMTRLPLGIRMDAQGVRIGGVAAAEKGRSRVQPRDKPIQGFTRAMHVYSCDWDGVRRIKVLTDPTELLAMAATINTKTPSGYAYAWWGRLGYAAWAPGRFVDRRTGAVLVIEVERQRASFQPTRPAKGPVGAREAQRIYTGETMVWVIPTRDPQRLRAALATAAPPIPED
jgi:hypothetical protein